MLENAATCLQAQQECQQERLQTDAHKKAKKWRLESPDQTQAHLKKDVVRALGMASMRSCFIFSFGHIWGIYYGNGGMFTVGTSCQTYLWGINFRGVVFT